MRMPVARLEESTWKLYLRVLRQSLYPRSHYYMVTGVRYDIHIYMATNSTIPLPKPFEFARPEEWPRWIKRFERYRVVTELNKKDGPTQVSTLIYAKGEKAEDVLTSLSMSADELKDYSAVKTKLEGHFVKKRYIIFERARFNQRRQ